MQVKLLRKNLIDALAQSKEVKVNILGVTVKRQTLLQLLKLNNQDEILSLAYGNLSWPKPESPCLQISLNHTTMRFLDRPAEWLYGSFEGATYLNILTESATNQDSQSGIDIKAFLSALQNAMIYAATDGTRPVLQCVRFEFTGAKLSLIGADGFKLCIFKLPCKVKSKPFIIDTSDLSKVRQLMKAAKASGTGRNKTWPDIYIDQDKDSVTFTCQYATVKCSKVLGNYPDYTQLIPKGGTQVEVMAAQMLEAVQNVNTTARDGSGTIRLTFTGNEGQVSSRSEDISETAVKIDAKVQADCKVAVNGRYLLDTLKQAGDSKVTIFVTTSSNPIRFEWSNSVVVIMPMFVQW